MATATSPTEAPGSTPTNSFKACLNSCSASHLAVKVGLSLGAMGLLSLENLVFGKVFPTLHEKSELVPFVPKGFGLVILSNLLVSISTLVYLARKVVVARTEFKDRAKKDGGEVSELEFDYPKLYAEGNSEFARKFNAIQRGHQHALETYAPFVFVSLIAGIEYPITIACGGIAWSVSRVVYADIYAKELTPLKCKSNPLAYGIAVSHMMGLVGTAAVAMDIIGIHHVRTFFTTIFYNCLSKLTGK